MKYIKLYEDYEIINEEWFPEDVYLIDINEKITSYLEFYGDTLCEIVGDDRDLDALVHMILAILTDPSNVNNIVKANIFGTLKKGKKSIFIKKRVEKISIQIENGDEPEIFELLSNYGKLESGQFFDVETIDLVLNKPLELNLEVFGI